MGTVLFVIILLFSVGLTEDLCPDFIACKTSETADSCPEGQFFREKVKVHGCCPGCVVLKEEGENCQISEECKLGLRCTEKKECNRDPKQACGLYKYYDPMLKKTKYWKPSCLADGTYAPKQCKGEKMDGKCFCVDKMGRRIFGEEEWVKADNMTCACSRLVDEMWQKGMKPSYHCDKQGNFEPLQCDERVCWCTAPSTGIPYTAMVNFGMMSSLPCYEPNIIGAQYHRQCESVNYALEKAKKILFNHGTNVTLATLLNCAYDGSYHRVQNFKEKKRCVYADNTLLTEAVVSEDSNCNCAYDKHVAKLSQSAFMSECEFNGNYRTRQTWNGEHYCIDVDGFYFSSDPKDCELFLLSKS